MKDCGGCWQLPSAALPTTVTGQDWFALAKLGAVHVPVNTRYTPREIAYVTTDSGASLAIVDAAFVETFRTMEPRPAALPDDRIVVLDGAPRGCHDFETLVSASPHTSIPDRAVMPDDLRV